MASTALENHPLRRPDGTLPDIRNYPTGASNVMPSLAHERARTKILEILIDLYAPESLVAPELAILRDPRDWRDHLVPDILVALGAGEMDPIYGVLRRQYRLWDEQGPPDLVIELASRSTIGRDMVGKKEDYVAMGVREYVQFDPLEEFLRPGLRVHALDNGRYRQMQPGADGALPSGVLAGYDWVQQGMVLRLRDRATGQLVPTPQEARDREAARARAEEARADAAATHAQEEAARAQAATERARAEAARAHAAELAWREAEAARVQAEEARVLEAARARAVEAAMERLRAEIARLQARRAPDGEDP